MIKSRVSTPSEALAYMVDCTLATVEGLASKKSRSKYEFARQRNIAEAGIGWMLAFDVTDKGSRAEEAIAAGSVDEWAKQFMPEHKA